MRITFKQGLALAVILGLIFAVYQLYPFLLFKVITWQKQFNQQLSGSLTALHEQTMSAGLTLIMVSFLYGVFHAVGPGHGKFILTSYLSLEKTKLNQAIQISLLSALVQGVVAIVLVSIVVVAFTLSRSYFNVTLNWIERASFAMMVLFGAYWCMQAWKAWRKQQAKPKIKQIGNLQNIEKKRPLAVAEPHVHSAECGCGHQHLPTSAQMQQATDWKTQLMIVFSIGARPCSGAILVLFLAYTLNLYPWGMASALTMALGTGLTLSLFAVLVLVARHKAVRLSAWYLSERTSEKTQWALKVLVGVALILLGVTLIHGSFLEMNSGTGLLKR